MALEDQPLFPPIVETVLETIWKISGIANDIDDNLSSFLLYTFIGLCYYYKSSWFGLLQGVNGAVQYPKGFLKEAFELVRERGGMCIVDEVSGHGSGAT